LAGHHNGKCKQKRAAVIASQRQHVAVVSCGATATATSSNAIYCAASNLTQTDICQMSTCDFCLPAFVFHFASNQIRLQLSIFHFHFAGNTLKCFPVEKEKMLATAKKLGGSEMVL